jgi:hypothetical protein
MITYLINYKYIVWQHDLTMEDHLVVQAERLMREEKRQVVVAKQTLRLQVLEQVAVVVLLLIQVVAVVVAAVAKVRVVKSRASHQACQVRRVNNSSQVREFTSSQVVR